MWFPLMDLKYKIKSNCREILAYNLHELRSFVGFCSYYRRLSFANIAAPLHMLTKKGVRLVWGPEQQNAFEELKARLISASVLAMPIDDGYTTSILTPQT